MLKNFGTTLVSRQSGSEAWKALQPMLSELEAAELLEVDFSGVITFTPSWGDEVLTPLAKTYGQRMRILDLSQNPAIEFTLRFLERTSGVQLLSEGKDEQ